MFRRFMIFFGIVMLFWMTNLCAQCPDTLWIKTFIVTNEDYSYLLQQTTNKGYFIAEYVSNEIESQKEVTPPRVVLGLLVNF